ncbi:listeria-Bacteroides repeat domain (List_Bact_rpt) [Coprobacillus sp. CAG:698]|nr:listeria-Bacteroides repeat domain (List_Bact_rpt) [Coprobacillus sp. CAG:698]
MKNNLIRIISIVVATLIVIALGTVIVCKITEPKGDKVTITFETGDGSSVDPIEINKGEKLEKVPQSFFAGHSFIGWFEDEGKTKKFNKEETIETDKTLYADFIGQINDWSADNYNKYYDENCEPDKKVTIISDKKITKQEFLMSVNIEAVTGLLPDTLDVEIDKNEYTIIPGETKYTPGKVYKITVTSGLRFKDLKSCVNEYSFRIYKEEIENVKLDEKIKYILSSDVKLVDENNTSDEEQTSKSLNHNFIIKKNVAREEKIAKDDILCISEKKEFDPEISLFVKVLDVTELEESYYLSTVEAPIEDVFSEIDVNFEKTFDPSELIKNLNTKEMEKTILEGEGFKKMTTLIAGSVLTNKTVRRNLSTSPDFTENAYVNEDSLLSLSAELAEGATATIGIGTGFNPNFDKAYENEFLVLTFTFNYETTIKNKVDISVELVFTQYLALSMQGYMDYCLSLFKKKWLEFEYALNIYSQTDLDLTVLIRSANKKEDEYTDISEEIKNRLSQKEDEDDSNNVAKMLNDMLESENGDIDLFRGKILKVEVPVIPILPVLQVNFDLDFVVKVNFAIALNADASVLQATQVGAFGDTRNGNIGAIQHKLPGGDQYSIELSACGYLGLKAGFEGGLTISFYKTSYFGKVGLFVFVGPYIDMYGFAKVSLSKVGKYEELGKYISASVVGGYYIEIGMNIEISLEARSDFFKTKIGAKLVDEKIELFSFGNKEVLLQVNSKDEETVHMIDSSGSQKTSLDYRELIDVNGEYINITTGKTVTKSIDWTKFYLSFSNSRFTYDQSKGLIYYDRSKNGGLVTDECVMTYYYAGPCLQFNLNSLKSADRYPAGTIKLIWADTREVKEENVGKQLDVKVQVIVDGKMHSETNYKVTAGNKLGYVPTGLDDNYIEGTWNIDPRTKIITENTTITYTTKKKQVYVAFIYYDESRKVWITEIRASYVGEKPIAPVLPQEKYTHFKNWSGENGVNNILGTTSSNDISPAVVAEQMKYALPGAAFTDEPIDKALLSFESDSYGNAKEVIKTAYYKDTHIYTRLMHLYKAIYETETSKVTIVMKDARGNEYTNVFDINKGETVDSTEFYLLVPTGGKVIGFSYNKDRSDMKPLSELEPITEDTTFYTVYEYQKNIAKIKYFDGVNDKYEVSKTLVLTDVKVISESLLDEALESLVKVDGVEYEFLGWFYKTANNSVPNIFNANKLILEDIEIYPSYTRRFKVKFDANGGTLVGEEEVDVFEYNKFYLSLAVYARKQSKYYKYVFDCWKDINTGLEYKNAEEIYTLRKPTTFVAQYTKTEIIYNLTIETVYGLLPNNQKVENYQGGYDGYVELLEKYKDYKPNDVREEHSLLVYKDKLVEYDSTGENIISIFYNGWDKVMDKHTLTVNANGGKELTPNVFKYEYGKEINLSFLYTTKEKDDRGTYKLKGWKSSDGKEYLLNDKLTIEGDTTLTAIWEEDVLNEYKVYYYVNDELVETTIYHLGDVINELPRPENTKEYKFSGWQWYDNGSEIEKPANMPARNLIVKATTEDVYITYILDGQLYTSIKAKANNKNQLIEKVVKKGYTVSSWTTSDVVVTDGYFVMPEKNITFYATSQVNKYKLYYKHNGSDYLPVQEVEYGKTVILPNLPVQDGVFYEWSSDDIELLGSGFVMPDKDVTITTISSSVRKHLIYYINNEIAAYELVVPGKKIALSVEQMEGQFSGWYSQDVTITNGVIEMPNDDVAVYGFYTDGEIKINLYLDNNTTPSLVLYANKGEVITNPYFEGKKIRCWNINNEMIEKIVIDENQTGEINAYALYDGEYKVSYVITDVLVGEYVDEYYDANEKVYLQDLPKLHFESSSFDVYGWYSADGIEILTDENNRKYFIMPNHNVILNASIKDLTSEGGYYARLYIVTPFSSEKIMYREYYVYSNVGPVYFDIPEIDGCVFVHWQDKDGNIYDEHTGLYLDDMNGSDQEYTLIYKAETLQIATFRIDGEIYAYRTFYSSSMPKISIPKPDLPNGKVLSQWFSPYAVIKGDGFFLTDDMIGKDLVFDALTYSMEGEFWCELVFELTEGGGPGTNFVARDYDTITITNLYDGKEYNIEIVAKGMCDGEEIELIINENCISINGNVVTIKFPDKNSLSASGGVQGDIQLTNYIIKLIEKN